MDTSEPKEEEKVMRRFGFLKVEMSAPDDFDTMFQDEIIAMFYGEDEIVEAESDTVNAKDHLVSRHESVPQRLKP